MTGELYDQYDILFFWPHGRPAQATRLLFNVRGYPPTGLSTYGLRGYLPTGLFLLLTT